MIIINKRQFALCIGLLTLTAQGQQPIDFSSNNTSSSYITYNSDVNVPAGSTQDVKMARYCYFTSKVTGTGTINLYAGGERCYLGTKNGASWADWYGFTGQVHVYPFKEKVSNAGSYGIVLAHGGKTFNPEAVDDCVRNGRLNNALQNCRLMVHNGATLCNEANSQNAGGFRIGELQTEAGSTLRGYMKNDRKSYYLVGCLNTDATLAGTIAPGDYRTSTLLGLIKEGTGTYRITGNNNLLTGYLRVLGGRVLVNNDRAVTESQKLRGGLGVLSSENTAIAYVYGNGVLGGTGSIGGSVDNYGTVEPGDETPGVLTLKNYVTTTQNTNLTSHPASVLRFKVSSSTVYDQLDVNGTVKYSTATEDFSTSDAMPKVQVVLADNATLSVGDELTLLTAKSKGTGDWQFQLQKPDKYTWELEERTVDGMFTLVLKLVSMDDSGNPEDPDDPDNPDTPTSTMGAYYDDGINDLTDTNTLRYYAGKVSKNIGVALCTYKGLDSDRAEAGRQFNFMEPENEMKMDALQPNRGEFTFGSADQLVSFAQQNNMKVRGHCLVWHMQQPAWVSSDGKKNDKNWSRAEALSIMKTHIETVLQHFKGKVAEWDVVNECLDEDQSVVRTNPDGYTLRPTVWQRAIGDDYIDSALVYAHRADPTIKLFVNDYDVELQGKAKSVAYLNLVKHLKQQNIPLDGVGLQCHFKEGAVDSVKLDQTFRRFAEEGLECIITELDIATTTTTTAGLEEQARAFRVVTDVMLNNDNCPTMIVWGIKDNDSWRSAENPLLFTAGMDKKPAYYGVRSALRHRSLLQEATGVRPLCTREFRQSCVYSLLGIRVGDEGDWDRLPHGIYVMQGKLKRK